MNPTAIFYVIIGLLLIDFMVDKGLDYLNAKHFKDPIPDILKDVYDEAAYKKSQAYKKANYSFSMLTSSFFLIVTLVFFFLDGFAYIDMMARRVSDNDIWIALVFFGMIMLGSDILNIPFAYYQTFGIEERFGFNTTTKSLFFIDKLKSWFLMVIIGGGLLALIIWFYKLGGVQFWWYAWGLITAFTVFMNMFYSKVIVPLFNTQTPLEEGPLKNKIKNYAAKTAFGLDKIFVMDGSKRSTKANAYFAGFGRQKHIVLYDTLLEELDEDEIVAVLAHEVGHYKRGHIIFNMLASVLLTGFTLYILSLFITLPEVSLAIGVSEPSFHAGLIAFGILYSPISAITGLVMNSISRTFEYQADAFAKASFKAKPLVNALKKLSRNNLSNLTPHPIYIFVHYSHPSLLQRIKRLGSA